jgi:hypothetical protein
VLPSQPNAEVVKALYPANLVSRQRQAHNLRRRRAGERAREVATAITARDGALARPHLVAYAVQPLHVLLAQQAGGKAGDLV